MPSSAGRFGALVLASLALWAARSAASPAPHIYRLDITVVRNSVAISFALNGEVDPALARRLRSGLATSIRYDIGLAERNRYWFDESLDQHRLRITAEYDPIARDFVVRDFWDGRPAEVRHVHEFSEAAALLLSRSRLAAFRVRRGWPHKHLYVRMRASYDAGHFFALAPVDSTTDWKKSKTFKIHDADIP